MDFVVQMIAAFSENECVVRAKISYLSFIEAISHVSWAVVHAYPFTLLGAIRRSRFLLRSLLYLRASLMWFAYLRQSRSRQLVISDPSLLESVHRPFFDRRFSAVERAKLLRDNFELLRNKLTQEQFQDLFSSQPLALLKLMGKNEELIEVHLLRENAFKREGAATLVLSLDNARLLSMTFSLVRSEGQIAIKVGGIQSKNIESREKIRIATSALHGIQPRLLLIEVLRALARQFECHQIECVALDNHIYQAWRYRYKRSVGAEYNQLWALAGGVLNARGNYSLPISLPDKSISERPSNKRAEYRRRAALLENLRCQIKENLNSERAVVRGDEMLTPLCLPKAA